MKALKIDPQTRQVVIDMPKHRLSVSQKLLVNLMISEGRIRDLTNYIDTFSRSKVIYGGKPKPLTSETNKLQDFKNSQLFTGKLLREDMMAKKRPLNILEKFYMNCDVFGNDLNPASNLEKYPAGKAIGVEIECYLPITREEVKEELTLSPIPRVRCGTDSSINVDDKSIGYQAMEFRCLTSIDDMRNLEALCEFLKTHGARVNSSCGMHAHFDMRAFENIPTDTIDNYKIILPLMKLMVPESRLNSSYCEGDFSSDAGRTSGGRRSKINTKSFEKYKTLEVRLHSGTVNFEKISNWIRLCHKVTFKEMGPVELAESLERAKELLKKKKGLEVEKYIYWCGEIFGFDESLQKYILKRVEKFNPELFKKESIPVPKKPSHDNELENKPSRLHVDRESIKLRYSEVKRAWDVWFSHSRSKHVDTLKVYSLNSIYLKDMGLGVVRRELERQLGVKYESLAKKDFDIFWNSFYMYDKKRSRSAMDRLAYLGIYYEKFPDLYKKVGSLPKAKGEELLSNNALAYQNTVGNESVADNAMTFIFSPSSYSLERNNTNSITWQGVTQAQQYARSRISRQDISSSISYENQEPMPRMGMSEMEFLSREPGFEIRACSQNQLMDLRQTFLALTEEPERLRGIRLSNDSERVYVAEIFNRCINLEEVLSRISGQPSRLRHMGFFDEEAASLAPVTLNYTQDVSERGLRVNSHNGECIACGTRFVSPELGFGDSMSSVDNLRCNDCSNLNIAETQESEEES